MNKGYVYILSNAAMPGLVKIGRTTRSVEGRAMELYQTGVPMPFVVEHSVLSPDCIALERIMHDMMPDLRVGAGREFFRCSMEDARDLLDDAVIEQLRDFISEFSEAHVICEEPLFIDPGNLGALCGATKDVHPYEFADAIRFLDPAAVQVAVEMDRARRAKRREAREMTAEVIRIV